MNRSLCCVFLTYHKYFPFVHYLLLLAGQFLSKFRELREFQEYLGETTLELSIFNILMTDSEKNRSTLESGIDVGQGITVGPGKFVK